MWSTSSVLRTLLFALALPTLLGVRASFAVPLFQRTDAVSLPDSPWSTDRVLGRSVLRVDPAVLEAAPTLLDLELVAGVARQAVLVELERRPDSLTWRGRFIDDHPDHHTITLSLHQGLLHGTIEDEGVIHSLRPRSGNLADLVRVQAGSAIDCGVGRGDGTTESSPGLPADRDGGRLVYRVPGLEARHEGQVAMLVAYPPDVEDELGGRTAAVAYAQHAVDSLNTSFANSRMSARAFLSGAAIWPDGASHSPDYRINVVQVLRIAAQSESLAQLRDEAGADLVAVIASSSATGGCGVANVMSQEDLGPQWAPMAFSVTRVDCDAFGHRVFAHENGHVLGARHVPGGEQPLRLPVFPYAYGYAGDHVRTVMAPGATRLMFSTPLVLVDGEPAGVEGVQDNARALEQTVPIVAAFRTGGSPLPPPGEDPPGEDPPGEDPPGEDPPGEDPPGEDPPGEDPPARPPGPPGSPTIGATSPDRVVLVFDAAARASTYEVEVRGADPAADRLVAVVRSHGAATVDDLEPATPYSFRIRARNAAGPSTWSAEVSASTVAVDPLEPCSTDEATLCLLDQRFELRAWWRNQHAPFGHGPASARPIASSATRPSGLFTFFGPRNVELAVKILDGRELNGHFWHFYGALSDVEYWIVARDTTDGRTQTYHNPPFTICGQGDTTAFPAPGTAPDPLTGSLGSVSPKAEACAPGSETLCLLGRRFEVSVEWNNPRIEGDVGTGRVFAIDGEQSGHFWFFGPGNLELSVKILDARAINDHFWIFWGALTDVAYSIRVLDTETGAIHRFENPPFTLCGGAATDVL